MDKAVQVAGRHGVEIPVESRQRDQLEDKKDVTIQSKLENMGVEEREQAIKTQQQMADNLFLREASVAHTHASEVPLESLSLSHELVGTKNHQGLHCSAHETKNLLETDIITTSTTGADGSGSITTTSSTLQSVQCKTANSPVMMGSKSAEQSKPKKQSLPSTVARVYIVRHGERLDEVPGNRWYSEYERHHGRSYDPPLTDRGHKQASRAAAFIGAQCPYDVSIMYTSTLIRCVSTASTIANHLNLSIVACDPLAECAAAVRQRTLPSTRLASDVELRSLIQGDKYLNRYKTDAQHFRNALVELCRKHAGKTFIICAHREAIRDLLKEKGQTARLDYCAVAGFEYDLTHDTFQLCHAQKETVQIKTRKANKFSLWG